MTQKFYSASKLTEAAIAAFDDGKPFNPAGVRGWGSLFTVDNTDKEYKGKDCLLGDRITAFSMPDYIAALNKALEQGLNPDKNTARTIGATTSVIIKGNRPVAINQPVVIPQVETPAVEPIVEQADEPLVESSIESSIEPITDPVQSDVVSSENDLSGIPSTDEEITPLWDASLFDIKYARGLYNTEEFPKVALEKYAAKFGITLDRRKSFDGMLVSFEAKL